jgi:hypothetical protein
MLQIHLNARTTPAVRAVIARWGEPSGVLTKRYGISSETIRKWRNRGPEDCLDHLIGPWPTSSRLPLAGFYSARSSTTPPLQWATFSPPHTPSVPMALNRATQSQMICSVTVPIRAASVREAPS